MSSIWDGGSLSFKNGEVQVAFKPMLIWRKLIYWCFFESSYYKDIETWTRKQIAFSMGVVHCIINYFGSLGNILNQTCFVPILNQSQVHFKRKHRVVNEIWPPLEQHAYELHIKNSNSHTHTHTHTHHHHHHHPIIKIRRKKNKSTTCPIRELQLHDHFNLPKYCWNIEFPSQILMMELDSAYKWLVVEYVCDSELSCPLHQRWYENSKLTRMHMQTLKN
jgi:hypothetical protein